MRALLAGASLDRLKRMIGCDRLAETKHMIIVALLIDFAAQRKFSSSQHDAESKRGVVRIIISGNILKMSFL